MNKDYYEKQLKRIEEINEVFYTLVDLEVGIEKGMPLEAKTKMIKELIDNHLRQYMRGKICEEEEQDEEDRHTKGLIHRNLSNDNWRKRWCDKYGDIYRLCDIQYQLNLYMRSKKMRHLTKAGDDWFGLIYGNTNTYKSKLEEIENEENRKLKNRVCEGGKDKT